MAEPTTDTLIYDLQSVSKRYANQARPANVEISLQIQAGEIFGLLGDNGAGKSTLIKQMVNLLASTAGRILFCGKVLDPTGLAVPLAVGYMPQSRGVVGQLTVAEALYFTAHLRGCSRQQAKESRDHLLALWQLGSLAGKAAMTLSGGEGRLLQLALAMAGNPPILILDEPTNELAPQRRKQVWDNLRTLNQQQGTTIIFITHDALEAEKIIQRVGILADGRLVALGKPSDLKQQIDRQLRLEIYFATDQPPLLPSELPVHQVDVGRWLVYLERQQVEAVLATLANQAIDDFRLYSATLEDLYLHYTKK